jgi:hypothetical protein
VGHRGLEEKNLVESSRLDVKRLFVLRSTSMPILALGIMVLVAISVVHSELFAIESIYMISAEPQSFATSTKPFPTILWEWNSTSKELASVKSLVDDTESTWFVNCYSRQGIFMVGVGETHLLEINAYAMDSPQNPILINWLDDSKVMSSQLTEDSVGALGVKLTFMSSPQYTYSKNETLNLKSADVKGLGYPRSTEARFAGPSPVETSGYADIATVRIQDNGKITPFRYEIKLPVDSVSIAVPSGAKQGLWNIISLETDHCAFLQVPTTLESRFLLIYSRLDGSWRSFEILGQTRMRLVGDWISGTVMWPIPESDLSESMIITPRKSDSIVLVHPTEMKVFIEELDSDPEILYTIGDYVVFRTGDELKSGILGEDGITGIQLLATRDEIRHMHWAFPGGE